MSLITEADEYAFELQQRQKKRKKVLKKYRCDENVKEILSKFPEQYKLLAHSFCNLGCDIQNDSVLQGGFTLNGPKKEDIAIITLKNCVFCKGFNYEVELRGLDESGNLFKGCWYIKKTTTLLKSELREVINKIFREIHGRKAKQKGFHI